MSDDINGRYIMQVNVNCKLKLKVIRIDFTRNNKSWRNSYDNYIVRSGSFKGQKSSRNNNSLDFDYVHLSLSVHLLFGIFA